VNKPLYFPTETFEILKSEKEALKYKTCITIGILAKFHLSSLYPDGFFLISFLENFEKFQKNQVCRSMMVKLANIVHAKF
jgi:hypothetical protein